MFEIPDHINIAQFYLDRNLELNRGDDTAIYFKDKAYTYAQIVSWSNKVGNFLKSLDVQVEDRVMMVINDSPEFVASWYGIIKIGAVPTDVYSYLRAKDYEYFLNYTRAKVLIVDATVLPEIVSVLDKTKYLRHVVVIGGSDSRFHSFEKLVDQASEVLEIEQTHADDVALWKFTSGSTGKPKGVLLTHRNSLFNYHTFGKQVLKLNQNDIVLAVPKLFFGYARDITMLYTFASGAACVLFPERSTAERITNIVEQYRPTVLVNVPTMINSMVCLPDASQRDFSSLRFCTSAGEALPEELFKRWVDIFGVQILDCIGSCELCHVYISNTLDECRPGSLGKIVPGYEAKIVDEKGLELPEGKEGVLWVKGESQALGYWHAYHKTRETFKGEWLNTGDLFQRDKDGFYWFVGRGGDVLKVGGIFVAPLQIENCLLGHEAVKEAAVIGAKDDQGLIKPKAFIVVNENFTPSDELAIELQAYVKTNLAPYKYPRWISFLSVLPKDNAGKIRKKELNEMEKQHDQAAV